MEKYLGRYAKNTFGWKNMDGPWNGQDKNTFTAKPLRTMQLPTIEEVHLRVKVH